MKGYLVACSTGCTCCSNENHTRGPFSSREIAEGACAKYLEVGVLGSQYARKGRYQVEEYDAELLPDGRVIVANVVVPKWKDEDILVDDQVYLEIRS